MVFGDIGVAGLAISRSISAFICVDVSRSRAAQGRRQTAERRNVVLEIIVGLFGQLADRNAALGGARIDLVVDVGDVAHIGDVFVAVEMAQQPEQHVEDDHRARIADMGEVVDRRPADIHAHARGIDRGKRPLLPRQRIVEPEFHSK